MRHAIVENGVVVNVIVGAIPGAIPCPPDAGPGWTYDGEAFAPPHEDTPTPTPAEIQQELTERIDGLVESRARALQYNSAAHLAGYATSTVPEWAAEAAAFIAWRDLVWQAALSALAQAETTGVIPNAEDLLATLPAWPGVSQD